MKEKSYINADMPRIFGSNVRPDLPDQYGIDGSAKYDTKATQVGKLQQERNLLVRRKMQLQQQQQQYAAASNTEGGLDIEGSADAGKPSSDPRADPDYYDYYEDVDRRRQQLLNQLRKRQGAAHAVEGPTRATSDYDDYGGMAGVGTSAVGASAIDRHGYGPQKRAQVLSYLRCIN